MSARELIPKAKQKLYYIKWQDAHSEVGWMNDAELKKTVNEESWVAEEVGWIVYEDKEEVHLISRRGTWTKENTSQYGMYQRIPKAWILKRKLVVV